MKQHTNQQCNFLQQICSLPAAAGITTVWSAAPSPHPSVSIRSAWFCRSGSDLRKEEVIWLGGACAGNFTVANFRQESNEELARSNQITVRQHGSREWTRTRIHSRDMPQFTHEVLGILGIWPVRSWAVPTNRRHRRWWIYRGTGKEGGIG
jgi:hypothetical protein